MTTTTTTNYGWTIPNDSELVKDGAAAIRTLGNAADASLKTVSDAAVAKATIDAKGDLLAGTADNTIARLAVGTDGQVLTADAASTAGVKWSTPSSGGFSWTKRKSPTGYSVRSIATNGSNIWVSVGSNGELYSSTDAKTWTSRTSGFGTNAIYSVYYGNGLFVAGGLNGTLTTSTDGITWTARTSGFGTNAIRTISYVNSTWFALGDTVSSGFGVSTSTDGTTWTTRTVPTTTGTQAYTVVYFNGNYIVGGAYSTNGAIYSSNLTTWTAMNPHSNDVFMLYSNGTYLVAAGGTTNWSYSTNGTTWTALTTPIAGFNSGQSGQNFYYNGNAYYMLGVGTALSTLNSLPATIVNSGSFYYQDGANVIGLIPANSTTTNYGAGVGAIWAGSQGYIFGNNIGTIYTSF